MADIVQRFPVARDDCRCAACVAAARRFPRDPRQLALALPPADSVVLAFEARA